VNDFETPGNPVPNHDAPAGNHAINPGHLCMFSACTPASITLTCVPLGTDTDKAEVILLKRIKGTGATAGDKPAKQ
jgi:hypothetical protein